MWAPAGVFSGTWTWNTTDASSGPASIAGAAPFPLPQATRNKRNTRRIAAGVWHFGATNPGLPLLPRKMASPAPKLAALLVAVATIAAWAPGFGGPYHFDDFIT